MKMIVVTLRVKTVQLKVRVMQSFAIHLPLPLILHISINILHCKAKVELSGENGVIVFQGSNNFFSNFALRGGAMLLNDSTVTLNESFFFNNGAIGGRDELLKHLISEEFISDSKYQQLIDGLSIGKSKLNLSLNLIVSSTTLHTFKRLLHNHSLNY